MSFQYSCFISYRHPGPNNKLGERIVEDLYNALSNELGLNLNSPVYLDKERLQGGSFYNEALAKSLCRSVCMIVVFTPTYFSKENPYCSREYKAMERLEATRLSLLPTEDRQNGLIIPIVFRGGKYLPSEISQRRQYYNFEQFLLSDAEMSRHPDYAAKIKQIGDYVTERFMTFSALNIDPCTDCDNCLLPSEDEIKQWLEGIARAPQQFVMRGGK